LCDPRHQSPELRQTAKNLRSDLPLDLRSRLIVINADSPADNRRWLKKSGLADGSSEQDDNGRQLRVYSDEKMEWMRAYTALGDKRWSMTMYVLANERVQKLAREVDVYGASRAIRNAVESMKDEMRLQ